MITSFITFTVTQVELDQRWDDYIKNVVEPTYRQAGITEGYYLANYAYCRKIFSPYEYICLEAINYQYKNEFHKRHVPGWNSIWRVMRTEGSY